MERSRAPEHAQPGHAEGALLSDGDISEIGHAFLTLLLELRHLGALFALFEVFASLAQALQRSGRARLRVLPETWLLVCR